MSTALFILRSALPVVIVTLAYSIIAAASRPFDRTNRVYHVLMRSWSRTLLRLLRVRLEVSGTDRIDPEQAYIFLANHASYLDIIAIGATLPGGGLFVYKEELTRVPIWGWSLRASPFIMIRRADPRDAMRSIERAAGDIREMGESVVIFPEGTRSPDGEVRAFRRGGFLLAAKTGVPLVPLAIRDAHLLLRRGDWRVRPGTIRVAFGDPVPTPDALTRAAERELQTEMHRRLAAMVDGADRDADREESDGTAG